jgi:PAS domain-containing protein
MTSVLQKNPIHSAAYAVGIVLLAILYIASLQSMARSGEAVYAFALLVTTSAAMLTGSLALQQFRTQQRDSYLLVSAGMWVAAALHLFHFAAFAGLLGSAESGIVTGAVLRGATLPTLFVSFFLGLSLLANRQDRPSTAQPAGVFVAAATLGFIVAVAALVFPLPQAKSIGHVMGQSLAPLAAQPELLLIIAIALVGIAGILRRQGWRIDPYSRWALLALVVILASAVRFPLLSMWPSELLLLGGHALVLVSYLCVGAATVLKAKVRSPAATSPTEPAAPTVAPLKRETVTAPQPKPVEEPARPAELALRDLQANHRALRNATAGLLVGVRSDGTIVDWKPADDFGPTDVPSDLMGKNIRSVLPADQAEAVLAAVTRALTAGKTERLQFTSADGSASLDGYATAHSADQALCIVQDRTDQLRALQELDTQRREAGSLRRVTGDWLIRISGSGAIRDLQAPAASGLTAMAEMFNGKHLQDVFQGDDVTPLTTAAATALTSGELQELSFVRQSGQVLAVRVTNYSEDEVLCLLRDTTEIMEATTQLEESEEENRELRAHLERLTVEQSAAQTELIAARRETETSVRVLQTLLPDLILRLESDGAIVECKPAESFGPRDADPLVGARVRAVLPVDLASQIMAAIERVQTEGGPTRFTCHPAGGQMLAGGMAALGAEEFLCVVRDQTQQKQIESALAQQAAALARELQAKLEEEFLRSLRAENDALRAHLLRVAQFAQEGGTPSAAGVANPAGNRAPGDTTVNTGSTPLASNQPGESGLENEDSPPPSSTEATENSPQRTSPAATQAGDDSASTEPEAPPDSDAHDKENLRRQETPILHLPDRPPKQRLP